MNLNEKAAWIADTREAPEEESKGEQVEATTPFASRTHVILIDDH